MKPLFARPRLQTAFVVGTPLVLAVLELFHPHPKDLFALDMNRWMLVHYLQIPLFPLAALALAELVETQGFWKALCSVAMFTFGVTWVAFDTAAGVGTGILLQAAHASGDLQAWQAPVMALWTHPIVGGGGAPSSAPLLAVAGSVAWSVGAIAAAVSERRSGSSWGPVLLLVVSALGFPIFRTHAWPGGPITFASLAAAAAWLRWDKPG